MHKKLSTSYKPVNAVPQSATRLSDLMLQIERYQLTNKIATLTGKGKSSSRPSTTTNVVGDNEILQVQGRKSK